MDYVRGTYEVVTSNTAKRAVISSILFTVACTVLYGLAVPAYLLFYSNYLPDQVTRIPVHLQYGYALNPYGIASLADRKLKDQQEYDVTVTLSLPKSPANTERGNFMLALYLIDRDASRAPVGHGVRPHDPGSYLEDSKVIHSAFRPALVPYSDPWVSFASRLVFLVYHIVFPHAETVQLEVPMAEKVMFARSNAVPASLLLDVQAGQTLEVYSTTVTVTAKLSGLRWFMYTWWLTSFFLFTFIFWACEVAFMTVAWVVFSMILGGSTQPTGRKIEASTSGSESLRPKEEDVVGQLSDTPRTFPTTRKQPALKFEPNVKVEEELERLDIAQVAPAGGEADDEEEEHDDGRGWIDSGIGTSYSEGGNQSSIRRRASRSSKP